MRPLSPSIASPAAFPKPSQQRAKDGEGRSGAHLAAQAHVEVVLGIVADPQGLHERVVGVALGEGAHDLDAAWEEREQGEKGAEQVSMR